jgi:hypothetical protein
MQKKKSKKKKKTSQLFVACTNVFFVVEANCWPCWHANGIKCSTANVYSRWYDFNLIVVGVSLL